MTDQDQAAKPHLSCAELMQELHYREVLSPGERTRLCEAAALRPELDPRRWARVKLADAHRRSDGLHPEYLEFLDRQMREAPRFSPSLPPETVAASVVGAVPCSRVPVGAPDGFEPFMTLFVFTSERHLRLVLDWRSVWMLFAQSVVHLGVSKARDTLPSRFFFWMQATMYRRRLEQHPKAPWPSLWDHLFGPVKG